LQHPTRGHRQPDLRGSPAGVSVSIVVKWADPVAPSQET
jgi:hypothetical protein